MPDLAVPNPATWETGEDVSAQLLNAQLRDSLNFLLNPPIFAAVQTTTTAAWGAWGPALALQKTLTDTYGGWNGTSYTAQVAGWYWISGVICFAKNSTGFRSCAVAVNGTRVQGSAQDLTPDGDYPCVASKPVVEYLNVGDYVTLTGFVGATTVGTAVLADLDSRLDIAWAHA